MAEKTNQQNAVVRFYRETKGELLKVSWPTREDATRLTGIVLAVLVAMAIILGSVDAIGAWVLDFILTH